MGVLQIAIAILGAVSVFLGYRLFCDRAFRLSKVRFLAGALLTLFGAAILSADLVGLRSHGMIESRPAMLHAKPTGVSQHRASTDWFV